MLSLFFGRPSMMDDCGPFSKTTNSDPPISTQGQTMPTPPDETLSIPPLWDGLLDHQSISQPEVVDVWPVVSTLLLTKQAELGQIIKEIQSQVHFPGRGARRGSEYWLQALYNKLNARLWSWHDSLPGAMRWNRWSSNLDEVDQSLANLQ